MQRQSARTLAIVLLVVGLVLVVIGVIYFTVAADKLPSILGHMQHVTAHRTKRGTAALVLGAASLVGAFIFYARAKRHHS
jgi:amino acid permease